jgi:hypothetical protein
MTSRLARAALLSVAAATLVGCGQSDIAVHESRWAARSLSSYRYAFQWGCFCAPDFVAPVDITVAAGAISAVKNHDSGAALPPARFADYRTISGLFDFLHEAERRNAARITVTWDPTFSYPAHASIDYVANAVDDEVGFDASGLTPLP